MIRTALISLAALATCAAVGCTSFAFKNTGKGSAPDELKSRTAMIAVPGGSFTMGAQEGEVDEYPPHKLDMSAFVIDKTEVTLGDYTRCVQAHVCRAPKLDEESSEGVTEMHPVVGVSWFDATKYCEWVGKRLPTEAEWEYAARAPRFAKFPWDGRFDPTLANAAGNADGYERSAPVGSFPKGASGLGLQDMGGNAAEWVSDWYESTWYQKTPQRDPKGPSIDTGGKVVRGGSWSSNGDYLLRSTSRTSLEPNISNDAVGFRCAADK